MECDLIQLPVADEREKVQIEVDLLKNLGAVILLTKKPTKSYLGFPNTEAQHESFNFG